MNNISQSMQIDMKKEAGSPIVRAFASFAIIFALVAVDFYARSYYSEAGFGAGIGFGMLFVSMAVLLTPVAILFAVNAIRRLHQKSDKTTIEWTAYIAAIFSILLTLVVAGSIYYSVTK